MPQWLGPARTASNTVPCPTPLSAPRLAAVISSCSPARGSLRKGMSRRRAGRDGEQTANVVEAVREAEARFEEELAHDKEGLAAAGAAPAPPAGEEATIWYFAFGSNINKKVFEGRRMIKPAESLPAILPGHRLCFNMPGMPYREPGFGSVEPIPAAAPGGENGTNADADGDTGDRQEVHGVVHRVTPTEWKYILETEGAAGQSEYGYGVREVGVRAYDGRQVQALTLMAQPKTVAQLEGRVALPSKRYLELIREGAGQYGLDPSYRSYLGSLQHYEAKAVGQKLAGLVMAAVGFGLLLPVFVPLRLARRVFGLKTGAGVGAVHGRLLGDYFRAVFGLLWWLHGWLRPVLGSGCS